MTTEAPAKNYSEDERHEAMAIYAFVSGRADVGEGLLEDAELSIPWGTVHSWVSRERDLYLQIKGEIDGHTRLFHADSHRRLAALAMENAEEAQLQIKDLLDKGGLTPAQIARLGKELGVISAIHTDKAELLSDRPTSRVKHDLTDLTRALEAIGIEVLEGTAIEEGSAPALPAAS